MMVWPLIVLVKFPLNAIPALALRVPALPRVPLVKLKIASRSEVPVMFRTPPDRVKAVSDLSAPIVWVPEE